MSRNEPGNGPAAESVGSAVGLQVDLIRSRAGFGFCCCTTGLRFLQGGLLVP